MIYDDTLCQLGEGPLWHPLRGSLFWFDILGCCLYERAPTDSIAQRWEFDEFVSAAAWVDEEHLLVASQTSLSLFNANTGDSQFIHNLEADNLTTRSNDGRADPFGGFWIGTVGLNAETNAGAIYRFYKGELRKLIGNITISNSICFSPDGKQAYYCDTPTKKIMKVGLDDKGWPNSESKLFVDVAPHNPDGSVVDIQGNLYNAQWGSNRVAIYSQDGDFIGEELFEASHTSCPAIGGEQFNQLFVTSASIEISNSESKYEGAVFISSVDVQGQKEHQVILN